MEDLLRIPFVLLALAAILLCYLLDQRRRDPGTEQDKPALGQKPGFADQETQDIKGAPERKQNKSHRFHLVIAIGLLAGAIIFCAAFLFELEKYVYGYFVEPFPDLEGSFLLKHRGTFEYMGLGLIYGLLLYAFYRFVLKHDEARGPVPKLMVGVWVTVIVVFTAVGLFKSETKMLMASVKRLETPAGAIEFAAVADESEISISYDTLTPTKTDTDFQAGAKRLGGTLSSVESDFKKIIRFCREDLTVGPYCAPFFGDADVEKVKDGKEALVSAMAVTYGYARVIKPIATCLSAYACFFENGVPIQDDLSEIAASYATSPGSSDEALGCPRGGDRDPMCDPLERILKHLKSFKKQGWNQAEEDSCPYLVQCLDEEKNALPEAKDVVSHRDAVLATGKTSDSGNAQENRETGFILPYRPMISAALLTASGYPEEAVGHMEREYRKLRGKFGRTGEGGEGSGSPDFVETVLRLRLLHGLQQVSDHANKQDITLEYQEQERNLAIAFLKKNMNVDGRQREKLLEKCVEGISGTGSGLSDNDIDRSKAFKTILQNPSLIEEKFKHITKGTKDFDEMKLVTKQWKSDPTATVKEDWDAYVSNFLFYFVSADFRRLQARARQHRDKIEDEHLVAAGRWWNITIKNPNLIKDCFSRMPFASPGLYRFLKFQMVYTYGLLHAQKASWLSQKAELARSGLTQSHVILVDMDEVRDYVCKGYTGLRRAYNTGKVLMDEDPDWTAAVEQDMWRTSGMLRRLVAYMDAVGGNCLH